MSLDLNKNELLQLCRDKGLTGYSRLRKDEIRDLVASSMSGGELDEKYLIGKYGENYRYTNMNTGMRIRSRKEYADSPSFFIALSGDDNPRLFDKVAAATAEAKAEAEAEAKAKARVETKARAKSEAEAEYRVYSQTRESKANQRVKDARLAAAQIHIVAAKRKVKDAQKKLKSPLIRLNSGASKKAQKELADAKTELLSANNIYNSIESARYSGNSDRCITVEVRIPGVKGTVTKTGFVDSMHPPDFIILRVDPLLDPCTHLVSLTEK